MENLRSKPLIEGAILTAIVFILMMISNMPGLYILGNILVPIPVAILYIKHKWKTPILSVLVGFILVSLLMGPIAGINAALFSGLVGIPLGYGVRAEKSGTITLFYMVVGSAISFIISAALTIYISMGTTLNAFLNTLLVQYKEATDMILKSSKNQQVADSMNHMMSYLTIQNMKLALPIGLVFIGFITAIIIYNIARNIMVRLKFKVQPLKGFSQWYISPKVVAILIVIAVIGIELKSNGVPFGKEVFVGTWGILFLLFALQGLGLVAYFISKKLKANKIVVVVIFIFLITSGMLIYLVPIGLVDVILDYRNLDENSLGSFIRRKFNPKK
ncbi:MAG: DUF2232 domain-containing protein [Sarcina sp.]